MRYAIIVLFLTGCAQPLTPQERADQFEAQLNHLITTYGPACERVYPSGSDKWANCVVMLAEKDQAQQDRRAANAAQMMNYWNANRPRQTNCYTAGSRVNCTTY